MGETELIERMTLVQPSSQSDEAPILPLWAPASFSHGLGSAGKLVWLPHLQFLFLILAGRVAGRCCGFLITMDSWLSRCATVPLCLWRGSGFLSMKKFDMEILGGTEVLHMYLCDPINQPSHKLCLSVIHNFVTLIHK